MLADEAGTVVFRRAAGRQAFDAVGSSIGALLFLGMAVLLGGGALASDLVMRLFGLLGFGFFGLFMAAGAVMTLRRGTDSRVAEIGPAGAWLPEMGFLTWSEIAEVRLEAMRGAGSATAPVTARYERLGFVPRDPSLKPSAASSLAWGMTRAYFGLVRMVAPQLRAGGGDPAPFGVGAIEIGSDFDRLVETTRRFAPVLDQDDVRAHARVREWTAPVAGTAGKPADIAILDAGLAAGAVTVRDPARSLVDVDGPAPQPRAEFGAPAVGTLEIVFGILPLAVPVLVIGPIVAPMVLGGGSDTLVGLLFVVVLSAIVVPGARQLIRLAARIRASRSSDPSLRIGPDGIWTPNTGLVSWPDVDQVRTERAGWVRQIGGPSYERWQLAVTTTAGVSAGVRSDEIDARFDDVLDLIRLYHPVSESS